MNSIDGIHRIKMVLKKRKRKGLVIVTKPHLIGLCLTFNLNFTDTLNSLRNNGVIRKYSKNGKGFPYQYAGNK